MKGILLLVIVCIGMIWLSTNVSGFDWGTSIPLVVDDLGEPLYTTDLGRIQVITYKDTIADSDCYVAYLFLDSIFVERKVMFIHLDALTFVRTYHRVFDTLLSKYGKATKTNAIWVCDTYRERVAMGDRVAEYLAISQGHLLQYGKWVNLPGDMRINLAAYGLKGNAVIAVEYIQASMDEELAAKLDELGQRGL